MVSITRATFYQIIKPINRRLSSLSEIFESKHFYYFALTPSSCSNLSLPVWSLLGFVSGKTNTTDQKGESKNTFSKPACGFKKSKKTVVSTMCAAYPNAMQTA
jgi:hypothetical protein